MPFIGTCQWSSVAINQTVSLNNLQNAVSNSVFTAKTTIPSGTKSITKTEANTYVNINTSNTSYSSKSSNQLVTKQDLTAVAADVIFTVTSGYYPVGGPSSTVTGNLINNTSSDVYIFAKFNSAGLSAGIITTVQNDYVNDGTTTNNILGSWSSPGAELVTSGYIVVNAGTTKSLTINKGDGLGSGSYISIGYTTYVSSFAVITWF